MIVKDETNDVDATMSSGFIKKIKKNKKRTSGNGRSPSNLDPIIAQATNECHRPLTEPQISNPVSVITAAETRGGGSGEEELKGKHGSAAAGGRFRSDPFPESRLSNVNFGRRC